MTSLIRRFWIDETAATSIEYALIAGGISIVILAAVTVIGTNVKSPFQAVSNAVR